MRAFGLRVRRRQVIVSLVVMMMDCTDPHDDEADADSHEHEDGIRTNHKDRGMKPPYPLPARFLLNHCPPNYRNGIRLRGSSRPSWET